MDVHIPLVITNQLRRRGVDVLTAIEDGRARTPDDLLLERAHELGRVLFTFDIRFMVMAYQWIAEGRPFSGLVYDRALGRTIGEYVESLQLIAEASAPQEWKNRVEILPI